MKVNKENEMLVSQEYLKSILDYDHKNGKFTWIISKQGLRENKAAGTLGPKGYICIRINSKHYKAHRLAWLYITGEWPKDHMDHINGIKNDNRIENLRECSALQNQRNKGKSPCNTSGYKGVYWHKNKNKWQASIRFNRKLIHLGTFDNPEEAHKKYKEAALKYHEEFANYG